MRLKTHRRVCLERWSAGPEASYRPPPPPVPGKGSVSPQHVRSRRRCGHHSQKARVPCALIRGSGCSGRAAVQLRWMNTPEQDSDELSESTPFILPICLISAPAAGNQLIRWQVQGLAIRLSTGMCFSMDQWCLDKQALGGGWGVVRGLICSVGQFLWCKSSYRS